MITISFHDEQDLLAIEEKDIISIATSILEKESIDTDELIIHLVSSKTIAKIHKEFFDDPTATDCISFPIDSPSDTTVKSSVSPRILGEIFACTEIAIAYSKEYKTDPKWETIYYIVHGILHLIGYDDLSDEDRALMRKKEKECMSFLKDHGYLDFIEKR